MATDNIKREKVLHGCDEIMISRPIKTFDTFGMEVFVNMDDYKWVGSSKDFDFYCLKDKT